MKKTYIAVREDGREIVATSKPIRETVKGSGIWRHRCLRAGSQSWRSSKGCPHDPFLRSYHTGSQAKDRRSGAGEKCQRDGRVHRSPAAAIPFFPGHNCCIPGNSPDDGGR